MVSAPRCINHKDRSSLPQLCHICQRLKVEFDIAERTIKALFAAHYSIIVNNGEDRFPPIAYDALNGLQPSTDAVLALMFSVDDERLEVVHGDAGDGWIRFVYGNGGYDVISDYTTNLESILAPVNAYADTLDPDVRDPVTSAESQHYIDTGEKPRKDGR